MRGIDVSHYQIPDGVADPKQEALDVLTAAKILGYKFVFAKATQGIDVTLVDQTAKFWAVAAHKLNLKFGVYHFAEPDKNSAETEADWFWWWTVSQELKPEVVILDVERQVNGNPPANDWIDKWCGKTMQRHGTKPFVYSYQAFFPTSTWTVIKDKWPTWVARTNVLPPTVPWTIWQHGQEQIANRTIDVNVWP